MMVLEYQRQIQLLDYWCWAAVTSAIALKYNPASGYTQGVLAGELLDSSCAAIAPGNTSNVPAVCNQQYSLGDALRYTQNFAWEVESNLTLAEIITQIDSGWPVCCQIYWADRNDQGHFITIYGYDGTTITIADSDPNAVTDTIDYYDLITAYRGGQWIRSFGTQPAPLI